MINKTCLRCEMKTIERRSTEKEGLKIDYVLYEISSEAERKYFALEIILHDESSLAVIGNDADDAYAFYSDIVEGAVTPCGLAQIVADRINCIEY